jgi:hypothetical protein
MLVRRLLSLVEEFEASKDAGEAQYAEWVGIRARVAVLHTISTCLLSEGPLPIAPNPKAAAAQAVIGGPEGEKAARGSLEEVLLLMLEETGKGPLVKKWLERLCLDTSVLQTEVAAVHQVCLLLE